MQTFLKIAAIVLAVPSLVYQVKDLRTTVKALDAGATEKGKLSALAQKLLGNKPGTTLVKILAVAVVLFQVYLAWQGVVAAVIVLAVVLAYYVSVVQGNRDWLKKWFKK